MTTRPIGIPIETEDRSARGIDSVEERVDDLADSVEKDMARASGATEGWRDTLGGLQDNLGGGGVAGVASVAAGAVGAFALSALDAADEVAALSTRTGLGTEFLQEYGYVARQTGGDIEDVADVVREMQLRLAEAASLGSGPAVDALDLLGISLRDIQELDAPAQFELLRDRISEVEDPANRLFAAEELLGGSSERLQGIISATSDEIGRLRREAHDTGQVLSEETVATLDRAHDTVDRFGSQIRNVATSALAGFIETLGLVPPPVDTAIQRIQNLEAHLDAARDAASETAEEQKEWTYNELREVTDALGINLTEALGAVVLQSDNVVHITELLEERYGSVAEAIDIATASYEAQIAAIERASEIAAAYDEALHGEVEVTDELTELKETLANITYDATEAKQAEAEAAVALVPLLMTLSDISYTAADAANVEAEAKARLRQQSIANQLAIAGEVEAYAALLEAQQAVLPIPEQYTETASQARRNAANLRAAAQGTYDPTLDIGPGRQPSGSRGRRPPDRQPRPPRPPRLRLGDYLVAEGRTQDEFDFLRRYGPRDQYGPNQRINLGQNISGLDAAEFQELLDRFSAQYGIAITNFREQQRRQRIEDAQRRYEEEQRALAKMIGEELDRTRPPCPPVTFRGSLITERDAEQTISAIQERVAPKTHSSPISGATGT